ncbi:MAG: ADP-L-glycero-D-manno-heptose-6-epimerase [Synergistales bacterium 53_16]|nr:MAG: ADP-L-glycero-D-manno-heptose-6-epimerase [Synergistales bacterium 53_16]
MIIVTGGAGFIGSNLVAGLNSRGISDILVVDSMVNSGKFKNLRGLEFSDYLEKSEFREALVKGLFDKKKIEALFHQGACSDTLNTDGRYMMENNYRYSRDLLDFCLKRAVPFIYASSASVYGLGKKGFREEGECEFPLNLYAFTKHLFDCHVRKVLPRAKSQVVGLRYFNVFGPQEAHKGRMASMVFHAFHQVRNTGKVNLFEGSGGYGPGQQRRDFVYVDDAVKVNLFFLDRPDVSGIFNCGTGRSRTFRDLAMAVINAMGRGTVEYIPFPDDLKGKYQSFTEADLANLRSSGYIEHFENLEVAVERYVKLLFEKDGYLFGEED